MLVHDFIPYPNDRVLSCVRCGRPEPHPVHDYRRAATPEWIRDNQDWYRESREILRRLDAAP